MAPHATLEIGSDGVAVITLTNPPVNALHPDCELLPIQIQITSLQIDEKPNALIAEAKSNTQSTQHKVLPMSRELSILSLFQADTKVHKAASTIHTTGFVDRHCLLQFMFPKTWRSSSQSYVRSLL